MRSFKDDPFGGSFTGFSSDGLTLVSAEFKNSMKDGPFVLYHPNGGKALEGTWRAGMPEGLLVTWNADGTLHQRANFVNGNLDGEYESRFEDGKIRERGLYRDGQRVGVWTTWDADGKIIESVLYSASLGR